MPKILYLKQDTLFDLFPKTPIAILKNIIYLNLNLKKIATQIYELIKHLNEYYLISKPHVCKILEKIRFIIRHYLKDTYDLEKITELNGYDIISIDESLFVHQNNRQIWIVRLINNNTREIRLEIVENRSAETMKKIIISQIPKGNIIITDAGACYN